MSKKRKIRKNLTFEELELGSVLFAGSFLLEGLLLMPKKELEIGDKTVEIEGIFSLTQPQAAVLGRTVLNDTVPALMKKLDDTLQKYEIKETLENKILDFLFVTLEEHTLKDAVSFFFDHSSVLDNNDAVANTRDYMYDVLTMENDREKFLSGVTDWLIRGLRTLTSGTILSILVNEQLMATLEDTITLVVKKVMNTSFGLSVMDKMFGVVSSLEDQSVTSFLADTVGITEDVVTDFIDSRYDYFLGEGLRNRYLAKNYGDELYNNLAGKDYDAIWNELMENHQGDLINLAFAAASAGIFLFNKHQKKVRRQLRKEDRKAARLERRASNSLAVLGLSTEDVTEEE